MSANSLISIVVPVFNESDGLDALKKELDVVLESQGIAAEIILVDDGSSDESWQKIALIHKEDPKYKGVRLSKNFGHQYALLAGIFAAKGDAVISMDADLQHPPKVIVDLLSEWHRGFKIVHTVREDNEDISWFKKITSRAFYRVFSFLSGVELSAGMADFRLLDRQVVEELRKFPEEGIFLRGIVQWLGYPSASVKFKAANRFTGKSKYNFKRMFRFAWAGITGFSIVPLRLAIFLGFFTSALAFAELGYVVCVKLFTESTVPGWASAVGVVSLLFGILFILLGIIGEYLGRVLEQTRMRPRYLISEQTNKEETFERQSY